jgi:hypothetical protein
MRKYPCKADVNPEAVEAKMREIFDNVRKDRERYISTYSKSLEVSAAVSGKREISVETKTIPGEDQEVAVKLYNRFLEEVTGYTAKERKKMVSKR